MALTTVTGPLNVTGPLKKMEGMLGLAPAVPEAVPDVMSEAVLEATPEAVPELAAAGAGPAGRT